MFSPWPARVKALLEHNDLVKWFTQSWPPLMPIQQLILTPKDLCQWRSHCQMLLFSLILAIIFQNCVPQSTDPDDDDHADSGSRIMGGTAVKVEDYSFIVTIYGTVFCGGSVLSKIWVLTAAHCIDPQTLDETGVVKVRGGFNYSRKYIQHRIGNSLIQHPNFSMDNLDTGLDIRFDIGLVHVDPPFKLTKVLNLARLPTSGFTNTCRIGRTCGIGSEFYATETSMTYEDLDYRPLKCVDLHLAHGDSCMFTFRDADAYDAEIVYTLEMRGKKDACQGDSGGPLICNNRVIGIVSSGAPCGTAGACASYTKVEYYLPFIKQQMKKKVTVRKKDEKPSKRKKGRGVANTSFWQLCCIAIFFLGFFS